jgi:hypothetical protein
LTESKLPPKSLGYVKDVEPVPPLHATPFLVAVKTEPLGSVAVQVKEAEPLPPLPVIWYWIWTEPPALTEGSEVITVPTPPH